MTKVKTRIVILETFYVEDDPSQFGVLFRSEDGLPLTAEEMLDAFADALVCGDIETSGAPSSSALN